MGALLVSLAAGTLHAQVVVTLSTTYNSLLANQTATLTALVNGNPTGTTTNVTWTLTSNGQDVTAVCPSSGSIATACLTLSNPTATNGVTTNVFKAPSVISSHQTITVTAKSVADPTQSAAVLIQLTPTSITITVSAAASCSSLVLTLSGTAQTCQFSAFVSGTSQTAVTWSIGSATGSISASGLYTSPASVSASTKITVTATLVSDTTVTGSATLTLQPPPVISVSVSPTTASLGALASQQFAATVANSTDQTVVWTINPSLGSIDQTGLYTAPASFTSGQAVTVTATSHADSTKSGTAKVTLQIPAAITVTVSPSSVTLNASQTQLFTASVANTTDSTVTWSLSPAGLGTIDSNGLYTAPSTVTTSQRVTVTATSAADPSKIGTAAVTLSVLIDVGTGASTTTLKTEFVEAFYRGSFSSLVALPPQGQVASLGGGVYGQKFYDTAKDSGVTYALTTASSTVNPAADGSIFPVAQIYPAIFAYYSTVGAATAGAPTTDTQTCPYFDPNNSCTYQYFDKNYLLFAYANALSNGVQNVYVSSTFYTAWNGLGGFGGGPGLPTAASATLTASTGTTATAQPFTVGEIFSVTSGANKGQIYGVVEPIFDLYMANGGASGTLGLPVGSAVTYSSGITQQSFEGGVLQYSSAGGGTVLVPVGSVVIAGLATGGSFTLSQGQTMTLSASVLDKLGNPLTGRYISWVSTSSQVVSVTASGATATLTAVGGGTATVLASSGGITSARVTLVVTVPCCQVGDGAPLAVETAFQTALSRNQIGVQLPVADSATRVGNGYVQTVQATISGSTVAYLLTDADQASAAHVVTGALLAAYQSLGGPGGTLGYPTSDASAGGTQLFANGALGGNPIHLVTGLVLTKWQALSYDTGVAGAPTGDASPFSTIGGNSGSSQAFAQGTIYGATAGPRAGQAYFVSGLILSAYTAAGGVAGNMGMPVGDATLSGTLNSQSFEGGVITYSAGDAAAKVTAAPKVPSVAVAPATVSAGGVVVFAIAGFPNNSTVRVSMTGRSDFLVTTANGAYSWNMYIPLSSTAGTVAIHAADTGGSSTADGTLTVRSLEAGKVGLTKLEGDSQTGLPGAALPLPLVVALADSSGMPVIGETVVFQASSAGAQLSASSAVTDSTGQAQTYVRLPASTGVTLVTATLQQTGSGTGAGVVTFGLIAAASSLSGFPSLQQSGSATLGHGTATIAQKGALLTAVASILQYHQNRGELPSPNGLATPAALNGYLASLCSADSFGKSVCDGFLSNGASGEQIVNLWRAAQFTGGVDVTVATAAASSVADLVAQGEPVLLSLGLSNNGVAAGGHFVTAVGVAADGSLVIEDPNPLFARTSLNDYLNGFAAGGGNWRGTLLGAVRFAVRGPSATRFLASALSQPAALMSKMALSVSSAAGVCGATLQMQDTVDSSGNAPAGGALVSLLSVCDGAQAAYQIDVGTSGAYSAFATDLASGGSVFDLSGNAAASYTLTRPVSVLVLSALVANFAANAVVNGATFTSGLAPGGIAAIFGTGLSGAGTATTVDVDGTAAAILFASAFQVNVQIPPGTAPGVHTLRIKSAYGTAQQQIAISTVAPAIFLLNGLSEGAVLNQDNSINTALTPLPRGQVLQIYATGLGATTKQGQYSVASTAVTAVVNGTELATGFAGLAPGYVGLYQVNVPIPATLPPGSGISLTLKQGGQLSNAVTIALQ